MYGISYRTTSKRVEHIVCPSVERSGSAPDSQSSEPGFESPLCYRFEYWTFSFSPLTPPGLPGEETCVKRYERSIYIVRYIKKLPLPFYLFKDTIEIVYNDIMGPTIVILLISNIFTCMILCMSAPHLLIYLFIYRRTYIEIVLFCSLMLRF